VARPHAGQLPPVTVHLDTPSVARVYDYFLGGSTNWAIDREFGRRVLDRFPVMRHIALIHRQFLNRVVRHLAARGVHQFLDIGSGVPADGSTHRVADAFAFQHRRLPGARVIYVDNDPIAVGHAEMLVNDYGDPRRHIALEADLRDPESLWHQVVDTELFDLTKPVALLLIAVLHLQQPDIHGNEIGLESARRLQNHLPPGSYVAVSHVTDEGVPSEVATALAGLRTLYNSAGGPSVTWRSRKDISAILRGLTMLTPGWTSAIHWRPEETEPGVPRLTIPPSSNHTVWAGVGRTEDSWAQ
jgi:hypothetical protein